jgi:hypothetical protein
MKKRFGVGIILQDGVSFCFRMGIQPSPDFLLTLAIQEWCLPNPREGAQGIPRYSSIPSEE